MTAIDWVDELQALATRLKSEDVEVQFHRDDEGPEPIGWAVIGRSVGLNGQVTVFQSGACNLDLADESWEENDGMTLQSREQLEAAVQHLIRRVREGSTW